MKMFNNVSNFRLEQLAILGSDWENKARVHVLF